MSSWIIPVANWLSRLYSSQTGLEKELAIERWLQTSRGWLPGLRTILPPPPPFRQYHAYCLAKTDVLEIWLLAWGAHTSMSDLPIQSGWMRVIHGVLFEETDYTLRRRLPGDTCSFFSGIHRTLHSVGQAYSVHVYVPGMDSVKAI